MTAFGANPQQAALAAVRRGDYAAAAGLCRQVLAQNKKDVGAMSLLAHCHHVHGQEHEAAELLRRCVKLEPKNPSVRVDLGEVYASQARYREALTHLDTALKLRPNDPDALMLKAMVLEREGRHARALDILAPVLRAGDTRPGIAAIAMRLMTRDGRADEALTLGRAVAEHGHPPSLQLRDVHFAIARAHETLGDYTQTMAAAAIANGMFEPAFDRDAFAARIDTLIDTFTAERLAALPRPANPSDVPVFIVGLPRTGSTLTERIIHTHPAAHGAGEIGTLPRVAGALQLQTGSTHGYPRCVTEMTADVAAAAAASYVDELRAHAPRATRIVDKYLANIDHVGLIDVLFPAARVIHCRRDLVDTCLSCYLERLTPQSVPYATDLRRLGFVARQYDRLVAHWREVSSVAWLDVEYEKLIADQPGETRRILEFCDLPWDDRCLRFHEARRHDNTLSFDQVRKPLYNASVGRASRFGPLLDPLRESLGES